MHCEDYISHYRLDAELFDYFEKKSGVDRDSTRRIQQAVLHELHPRHSGFILDIGSGNGWLADATQSSEAVVISCDLSFRNLQKIKANSMRSSLFVVCDAHHLPFRESCISQLVASEMLEHVNEPERVLQEFFRVLSSNAKLIISTPYQEIIRTYLCVHCNKVSTANAHLHSFDEHSLERLSRNAGFTRNSFRRIQNKLFLLSRLSFLCRFLPFRFWRFFDAAFTMFFNKPLTIILTAQK